MKIRRLIPFVLTVVLLLGVIIIPANADETTTEQLITEAKKIIDKEVPQESKSDLYRDRYQYISYGDYEVIVLDDGTYAIVNYVGLESDLVIPGELNGVTVSNIYDYAFKENNTIKNVTIPDGVNEIGLLAFYKCANLQTVRIPSTIKRIRAFAFGECFTLTLYGDSNSPAEDYAKKYNVPFVSTGEGSGEIIPDSNDEYYNVTPVPYTDTEYNINLYALDENYKGYVEIPNQFSLSYQIKLPKKYNSVTYTVSGDSVSVSSSGLIRPKSEDVTIIGDGTYKCYSYDSPSTVIVNADDDVYSYTVNVRDYSEMYAKAVIDNYMKGNIDDSMSDYEKLESIGRFVGGYDYIAWPRFISAFGMVICRGGDCWSSTYLVNYMAESLGFYTRVVDLPGGSHRYSIVTVSDGTSYGIDYGFVGYAPRYSNISEISNDNIITDQFVCKETDENTLKILEYRGEDKENIDIPSEILGIRVSEVDDYAFCGHNELKSVTIPNSVDLIGVGAFADCKNLSELNIPNSVDYIEEFAFHNTAWYNKQPDGIVYCSKIAYCWKGRIPKNHSLVIKTGTRAVSPYAFSATIYEERGYYTNGNQNNVANIVSVKIPGTVKIMGHDAFQGCEKLKTVTIEEGCSTVENGAFQECSSLMNFEFPQSVSTIGGGIFYNCTSLTSVKFPKSVDTIGTALFQNCSSLEKISYPKGTEKVLDFIDCTSLKEIEIPDTVKIIGDEGYEEYVFRGCPSIEKITVSKDNMNYSDENGILFNKDKTKIIFYPSNNKNKTYTVPDTVTDISGAFKCNSSLENLYISRNVNNIDKLTFLGGTSIKNIYVDKDNSEYSDIDGVLFNKEKTTLIAYPTGRTENSYTIPKGVVKIANRAFRYSYLLENVDCSDTVEIGERSFGDCKKLKSIRFSEGLKTIGCGAFENCSELMNITIPNSVTQIGSGCFYDTSVVNVFYNGTSAQWNKIKTVDEDGYIFSNHYFFNGFDDVHGFGYVNMIYSDMNNFGGIYYTVKDDGTVKITNCSPDSTIINIPNKIDGKEVTEIDFSALHNIPDIKAVTADDKNKYFSSVDGVVFNKSKDTLIFFPPGKTTDNYLIPESVKKIQPLAFENCIGVSGVTISKKLSRVDDKAFENCKSLKEISIPDNITEIGEDAFKNCKSLRKVKISDNVIEIGSGAFEKCISLESVNIPKGVSTINTDTFYFCSSLKQIEIHRNISYIDGNAFSLSGLESITVPSSVNGISWAFCYCSNLKEVKIEEGVSWIDDYAFEYCTSLEKAEIPRSVDYIGEDVFLGSDNIVIYGYRDSQAEIYANKNNIPFTSIGNSSQFSILGDVDGDGIITSADSLLILRQSVQLENFDDLHLNLADVDNDGSVTSADALEVLRYSVGLPTKGNIGEKYK